MNFLELVVLKVLRVLINDTKDIRGIAKNLRKWLNGKFKGTGEGVRFPPLKVLPTKNLQKESTFQSKKS